jgi:hypothetical protein
MKIPPPKTIEVDIHTDGRSSVKTKGFAGSAFLGAALGTTQHDQRTAEFYSASTSSCVQVTDAPSGDTNRH